MNAAGFPRIFARKKHSDWLAGGYAFNLRMQQLPYEQRKVVAHSYGGNCVGYGLMRPDAVPIHRLITVGTPTRDDMDPVWAEAVKNVGLWVHVCDPKPPLI